MKTAIALLLGLAIGAVCRWFDIPVPAPPRLLGALLVLAVTVGYLLTDFYLTGRLQARGPTEIHAAARKDAPR